MPSSTHPSGRIGRRPLLLGTGATLVTAALGAGAGRAVATSSSGPKSGSGGLVERGVNLDTDREEWRPEFVRREIDAIRHDLHCNSVLVVGSDRDRLIETASMAADVGLGVWIEARAFESDAATTLAFVVDVAEAAEELARLHPASPDIGLSVGCELTVFMAGLVPGDDWLERGAELSRGGDTALYMERLNDFLADAVAAVRPVFGGRITYTSEESEQVDWGGFDVVGVDLYRHEGNAATYVDRVRALRGHGKPVVITEFGCATYIGADDLGGMGFDVIDPATGLVREDIVRDEQVQADYIAELLDIFDAEGMHGAYIWTFIEPPAPDSDEPDLGFAIVQTFPSGANAYEITGYFEPKTAFRTVAERFA